MSHGLYGVACPRFPAIYFKPGERGRMGLIRFANYKALTDLFEPSSQFSFPASSSNIIRFHISHHLRLRFYFDWLVIAQRQALSARVVQSFDDRSASLLGNLI